MNGTIHLALASIGISISAMLMASEIVLRFLPVSTGFRTQPVTTEQPVFRAEPDRPFAFSKYWNLVLARRGWVNNAGFVNDQDYDPSATTPLIAVVGDSYIEAAMVPIHETLHGRLASAAGDRGRVYSFGFSGAALSQYLSWIEFARQTYRPDGFVVTVVGNDFDESLAEYKTGPGFHHYVDDGRGDLVLTLFEYRPNPLRVIVHVSALASYLVFNLRMLDVAARVWSKLQLLGAAFAASGGDNVPYVGNTAAAADDRRMSDSRGVIAAFFRDLQDAGGLPPERIVFVVDGIRQAIYGEISAASAANSYFARMRSVFIESARQRGYAVVDLHAEFAAHYAEHGKRFEFPLDWHWSGVGHTVAAEAVRAAPLFEAVLGNVGASAGG